MISRMFSVHTSSHSSVITDFPVDCDIASQTNTSVGKFSCRKTLQNFCVKLRSVEDFRQSFFYFSLLRFFISLNSQITKKFELLDSAEKVCFCYSMQDNEVNWRIQSNCRCFVVKQIASKYRRSNPLSKIYISLISNKSSKNVNEISYQSFLSWWCLS